MTSIGGRRLSIDLQRRSDITVETIAARDGIQTYRRRWGMVVAVYDDPDTENNGFYYLKKGKSTDILGDNANWDTDIYTHPAGFVPQPAVPVETKPIIQVIPNSEGHIIGVVRKDTPFDAPYFTIAQIVHSPLYAGDELPSPLLFQWGIMFVSNKKPKSIKIFDVTDDVLIYEDETDNHHGNGSFSSEQSVEYGPILYLEEATHVFKIQARDVLNNTFEKEITIRWRPAGEPPIVKHLVTLVCDDPAIQLVGGGHYEPGSQVIITAILPEGYEDIWQFVNWEVLSGGAVLNNVENLQTFFTMPAADVRIKANVITPFFVRLFSDHGTPLIDGVPSWSDPPFVVAAQKDGETVDIDIDLPGGYTFIRWLVTDGETEFLGGPANESENRQETLTVIADVVLFAEVTAPGQTAYVGGSVARDAATLSLDAITELDIPFGAVNPLQAHGGEVQEVTFDPPPDRRYIFYMCPADWYDGDVFIRPPGSPFQAQLSDIGTRMYNDVLCRVYASAIRFSSPVNFIIE